MVHQIKFNINLHANPQFLLKVVLYNTTIAHILTKLLGENIIKISFFRRDTKFLKKVLSLLWDLRSSKKYIL